MQKKEEHVSNIILSMLKALIKSKLRLGKINGFERYMLAQIGLPDRVPTALAATNVEPSLVNPKYNWKNLANDPKANLELFDQVCDIVKADLILAPVWMGAMFTGVAELGTVFKLDEERVPYATGFPIREKEDIEKIKLSEKPTGYLKMYFDIIAEAQKRYPDMLIPLTFDGPWDLAMLLRGDDKLPTDMRLHKDYRETDDPVRKRKIRELGDPDFYPSIMELTTKIAIHNIELAKSYGLPLIGSILIDQYAASPVMSRHDYVNYVLPYIEKVWIHYNKKLGIIYPCPSPMQMKNILENEPPGIAHQIYWSNYIFPTTPEGITIPEYDQPAFELSREYKKNFVYFVHGKFLREASKEEIEDLVKRVLTMAVNMRASVSLMIASVPQGTDLQKVNFAFSLTEKYGRY